MIAPNLQPGQRARITVLADVITTDHDAVQAALTHARRYGSATFLLPTKVVTPAGTTYEGTVTASEETSFELRLVSGNTMSFDANDSRLLVEQL